MVSPKKSSQPYKNIKVKVRSPDGDTDYFNIVAGELQGDTVAPYLFIICLDDVLRMSIDKMKENGFKLAKARGIRYSAQTITDADYANGIVLLANTPAQAESLLNSQERAAGVMGFDVNAGNTEFMCFNQRGDISSKTSGQVHLPRKQRFINREWHQHATSKGVDCYRYPIGHMKVRPDR